MTFLTVLQGSEPSRSGGVTGVCEDNSPAAGGVNPYLLGLWKEAVRKMVSWLVGGHPVSLDGGGEAWAPQIPSKLLTGERWAPSSEVGSEQDWPSSSLP